MGRVTAGVRGIKLRKKDFVEEVANVEPDDDHDILVVTDLGFGKRTTVSEFRLQGRGGYGVALIKLTKKNGNVVGMHHVREDDQVLMVTERGILIRMNVEEIRRIGRATQGVRLIRLDEGDRVVSVAVTGADKDAAGDGRGLDDELNEGNEALGDEGAIAEPSDAD
jgi:DNA gyrase subunit A